MDDVQTTCMDDIHGAHVTPGVVLHEIGQLRQVFAWVSAINLTSNNRRSGKSDKRKPSWTALHKGLNVTMLLYLKHHYITLVDPRSARDGCPPPLVQPHYVTIKC